MFFSLNILEFLLPSISPNKTFPFFCANLLVFFFFFFPLALFGWVHLIKATSLGRQKQTEPCLIPLLYLHSLIAWGLGADGLLLASLGKRGGTEEKGSDHGLPPDLLPATQPTFPLRYSVSCLTWHNNYIYMRRWWPTSLCGKYPVVCVDIYCGFSLWLISYHSHKSATHSMHFALAYVSKWLSFAPKHPRSIYSAKRNNPIWKIQM